MRRSGVRFSSRAPAKVLVSGPFGALVAPFAPDKANKEPTKLFGGQESLTGEFETCQATETPGRSGCSSAGTRPVGPAPVRPIHRTRRQAERELARLVADRGRNTGRRARGADGGGGTTATVNDAIAAWKDNGWEDRSPKTTLRYESGWANHIEGSIGRQRTATLGTYEVERYFRELKGKQLSEGSVRMIRAVPAPGLSVGSPLERQLAPQPVQ